MVNCPLIFRAFWELDFGTLLCIHKSPSGGGGFHLTGAIFLPETCRGRALNRKAQKRNSQRSLSAWVVTSVSLSIALSVSPLLSLSLSHSLPDSLALALSLSLALSLALSLSLARSLSLLFSLACSYGGPKQKTSKLAFPKNTKTRKVESS